MIGMLLDVVHGQVQKAKESNGFNFITIPLLINNYGYASSLACAISPKASSAQLGIV